MSYEAVLEEFFEVNIKKLVKHLIVNTDLLDYLAIDHRNYDNMETTVPVKFKKTKKDGTAIKKVEVTFSLEIEDGE